MPLTPTNTTLRHDAGPARAHTLVVAPTQPSRGVMVVELAGELDLSSVDRARRVLTAAVDAVGRESRADGAHGVRMVCDLDGLVFLSAHCGPVAVAS